MILILNKEVVAGVYYLVYVCLISQYSRGSIFAEFANPGVRH
jgi:hypothetical protein